MAEQNNIDKKAEYDKARRDAKNLGTGFIHKDKKTGQVKHIPLDEIEMFDGGAPKIKR